VSWEALWFELSPVPTRLWGAPGVTWRYSISNWNYSPKPSPYTFTEIPTLKWHQQLPLLPYLTDIHTFLHIVYITHIDYINRISLGCNLTTVLIVCRMVWLQVYGSGVTYLSYHKCLLISYTHVNSHWLYFWISTCSLDE